MAFTGTGCVGAAVELGTLLLSVLTGLNADVRGLRSSPVSSFGLDAGVGAAWSVGRGVEAAVGGGSDLFDDFVLVRLLLFLFLFLFGRGMPLSVGRFAAGVSVCGCMGSIGHMSLCGSLG